MGMGLREGFHRCSAADLEMRTRGLDLEDNWRTNDLQAVSLFFCQILLVSKQGVPARVGDSDEVSSGGREFGRGRSVGSTRDGSRESEKTTTGALLQSLG